MKTREAFKQVGGLFLPESFPDQVGLGCPKCDDHELVSAAEAAQGTQAEVIQRFLRKHVDCGVLEQLEVRGGQIGVMGVLDPRGSS